MNTNKKAVGFNKNIKKHGFIFYYNLRADPLLIIGYADFRQIPCRC